MPEISVIVPVYNTEKFLRRCVNSILGQTYADFELILVDDGSTDCSGSICEEYAAKDQRIRVFHQKNQGQAAARNFALNWFYEFSSSQYISFVDSDDWIHPRYLELLYNSLIEGDSTISACGMQRVKSEAEVNTHFDAVRTLHKNGEALYSNEGKEIVAYICGRLYQREIWKNMRFPEGRKWEDLAISYQLFLSQNDIPVIEVPLYYYYYNPDSTVNKEWTKQRMDFIWALEELLSAPMICAHNKVIAVVKRTYINALAAEIAKIESCKNAFSKEARTCRAELQVKLRNTIRLYREESIISFRNNKWIYEAAYPKAMQLYWIIRGVLHKVHILR